MPTEQPNQNTSQQITEEGLSPLSAQGLSAAFASMFESKGFESKGVENKESENANNTQHGETSNNNSATEARETLDPHDTTPQILPFGARFVEGFAFEEDTEQQEEILSIETTLAKANSAGPALEPCEISACSITESILFVGNKKGKVYTSREISNVMRGVSPSEVETALDQLADSYLAQNRPYTIEQKNGGYKLALQEPFYRMRDKFYGKVREAKLSSAILEVLSIVAYRQPVTIGEIEDLRKTNSGAALSQLVRRELVSLHRPTDAKAKEAVYKTTARFLQIFKIDSLEQLPLNNDL